MEVLRKNLGDCLPCGSVELVKSLREVCYMIANRITNCAEADLIGAGTGQVLRSKMQLDRATSVWAAQTNETLDRS